MDSNLKEELADLSQKLLCIPSSRKSANGNITTLCLRLTLPSCVRELQGKK